MLGEAVGVLEAEEGLNISNGEDKVCLKVSASVIKELVNPASNYNL